MRQAERSKPQEEVPGASAEDDEQLERTALAQRFLEQKTAELVDTRVEQVTVERNQW